MAAGGLMEEPFGRSCVVRYVLSPASAGAAGMRLVRSVTCFAPYSNAERLPEAWVSSRALKLGLILRYDWLRGPRSVLAGFKVLSGVNIFSGFPSCARVIRM